MAFCCVTSACIQGLQVEMIRVEADISNGLPMLHMVGYLSSEVKEAADRVRTALRNADVKLPPKKIMVNLAPATLRKKGASYDLPIAVSILAALGMIPPDRLENLLIVGELSLDGSVKKVPGILPVVWQARKAGLRACIVPEGNGPEGALAEGIPVIGVSHIRQLHPGDRRITYQTASGLSERGNRALPVFRRGCGKCANSRKEHGFFGSPGAAGSKAGGGSCGRRRA